MNDNGNNKNGNSHENIYGVSWDALNGLEELDNMLANKTILHNSKENLTVYAYASEGDVLLLTGRAWEYEYEYEYEWESDQTHVCWWSIYYNI